jgi:DNA-binding MarR family transcriptional regulator
MKEPSWALSEEVLVTLRRIMHAIDMHSCKLVQGYSLTGPQLLILKVLDKEEEISVGDLARQMKLSPATVTGVLDRLEKRVLVKRTRHPADKRRVMAGITEQGRDMVRQAPPLLQEHFMKRFAELKDWEQTLILASLQRVAAMMEAAELRDVPGYDGESMVDTEKQVIQVIKSVSG